LLSLSSLLLSFSLSSSLLLLTLSLFEFVFISFDNALVGEDFIRDYEPGQGKSVERKERTRLLQKEINDDDD
jgi:hypothetical protein